MNFSLKRYFSNALSDKRSVIGLDIGSSSAKVIQLTKKNGRAVLETYGEIALGPYGGLAVGQSIILPTDKYVEAVKDLLREANVTTKIAAIALPIRSSLLTVLELPSYKEDQINHMVPIEARKHIPVPISEVTLDWWVIPRHEFKTPIEGGGSNVPGDKIEVLLVAIHKGSLKKFQDISTALGLDARTYEIETFSSIRSVLARDISAMALLDVGAGTSKLTIIDYGVVRVSHTINKGAQDVTMAISTASGSSFTEAEKEKRKGAVSGNSTASTIMDYIFFEANSVIEEYQKKNGRLVTKVICTGGGALLHGFIGSAQKHFQSEVVLGDPFSKVETPAFLRDLLAQAGPEFAVALGLAIHQLEEA
ncbi:MAG TPA: type IV pilus assembly protein PilM [Candidatus Paceibacterota bacterium]